MGNATLGTILRHLRRPGEGDILGIVSRRHIFVYFFFIFLTRGPHKKMDFVAKVYIAQC